MTSDDLFKTNLYATLPKTRMLEVLLFPILHQASQQKCEDQETKKHIKNESLMQIPSQQSLDKHTQQKGGRRILTFGSTFREDPELGFENGGHHRICLEILPYPCIFGDRTPREKIDFFIRL